MYLYIVADGSRKIKIQCKLSDYVEELREIIAEKFRGYSPDKQRLIYMGKQLENGHTLFHYSIKNTNTIQLFKRLTTSDLKKLSYVSPSNIPVVKNEYEYNNSIADDPTNYDNEEEYICDKCNNDHSKKCKNCGCSICGGKNDEERTICCDECQYYYHFDCLKPKIKKLPTADWFCPECKHDDTDIVIAGQGLDLRKSKKAKMPSATQIKKWGGGMACVGVSKKCEIVDPQHFGPIPGIPVGTSWKYRIQCSESGVHRPPVGGIAGTSARGAVSIVLSGGYPEDIDEGFEFTYTGSGGRDLKTGNKRTAEQTFDQVLTRYNMALSRTCDAEVSEVGAEAHDWKKSMPIRVCRSEKLAKYHPEYAPKEGIRYDGIYKLVKYWPETGERGFLIWRYKMRRDDPEPAPWTKEGRKRIAELGLEMIIPDEMKCNDAPGPKKRIKSEIMKELLDERSAKKAKIKKFKPSAILKNFIKKDRANKRSWEVVLETECEDLAAFISIIVEEFKCPCCLELVKHPITTLCSHNICRECLLASLNEFGNRCLQCRTELASQAKFDINENLVAALHNVIPTLSISQNV